MAKAKTSFFCQNCGAQASKWLGKCPTCGEWNSYVEEVIQIPAADRQQFTVAGKAATAVKLDQIVAVAEARIDTRNEELNRVLGGGLVPGSVVLVGGEPGIGKSTLMLQVALTITNLKILYVSGEESEHQIKMRAERIGSIHSDCYILTETATQNIFRQIGIVNPDIVVIDSIQTLQTDLIDASPGSVSQIRECAGELQRFAKQTNTPVILIGHITKEGSLAGPKVLEHMVDTVLQFEGDRNHGYRILRSIKNRFGSTSELGIYEMLSTGLREISCPSEVLINQHHQQFSGVAIASTIEGIRPMLIETQALVSTAVYGTPQRSATGFDLRRLNMLLAVLEKRCGFRLGTKDVFLNIAGGIRVDDPAIDLAVLSAILSSGEDIAIPTKSCFAAEVGLSGELRPVNRIEQRLAEAEKMGFEQLFISRHHAAGVKSKGIEIVKVTKIEEVFSKLFG